jgi:hypothetical protein
VDIWVLDENLEVIDIVETFNSFIWTDRYNEYGDFELRISIDDRSVKALRIDRYLQNRDSDHLMIIDTLEIDSDAEDGTYLVVTGKSLESILGRRIVWGLKILEGNLQNGIKSLLNENVISPSNLDRKINNFVFEESTDPLITELSIKAQYTGDNLYDVIHTICENQNLGFKVTLNDSKQFVFKLYSGKDRSYSQSENPYVIFSPKFDNLLSGNYIESKAAWKNVTLVGGEGEGTERRYTAVGNVSGLKRREIFTDARDVSSTTEAGETISSDAYISLLRQRGKEKLSENVNVMSFEGEAEMTQMFRYGVDFFNGDVVQLEDEYGHEVKARITEIVTSESETGFYRYPTFVTIEPASLPEGYLRLEFIQSSGTQYVDTGFKHNQNTRVVMDAQFTNLSLATPQWLFDGRDSDATKCKGVFYDPRNNLSKVSCDYVHPNGDTRYRFTALNPSDRLHIDYNKNVITINGHVHTFSAITFQSNHSIALFALNNGGAFESYGSARIYSCKIYDNDFLVRDFVPCKNVQDEIGLYDFVTETFYANKGTGVFTT